jgi:hypothetical protein
MAIIENITWQDYLELPGLNASRLKPYSISTRKGVYEDKKPRKVSKYLSIGKLAHALILEGEAAAQKLIDETFITDGFPINKSTGKPYGFGSGKFQDWLATQDPSKDVIMPDDLELIRNQAQAVAGHKAAVDLLKDCPKRETAITWTCRHTGEQCKALVDFFGQHNAGDLKTFGRPLTLGALESEIYNRQYYLQFAFYADGLEQNGIQAEFFVIFVQSNNEHDVCVGNINYTALEQGRTDYIKAIGNFKKRKEVSLNKIGQYPQVIDIGIPYYAVEQFDNVDNLELTWED